MAHNQVSQMVISHSIYWWLHSETRHTFVALIPLTNHSAIIIIAKFNGAGFSLFCSTANRGCQQNNPCYMSFSALWSDSMQICSRFHNHQYLLQLLSDCLRTFKLNKNHNQLYRMRATNTQKPKLVPTNFKLLFICILRVTAKTNHINSGHARFIYFRCGCMQSIFNQTVLCAGQTIVMSPAPHIVPYDSDIWD